MCYFASNFLNNIKLSSQFIIFLVLQNKMKMKKLVLFFAVAAMAVSASAQGTATTGNKFSDNWYIGLNAGVGTATTHSEWLKNLNPNVGIRVGKNLTTVFGLAFEGNFYFSEKSGNEFDPMHWGSTNFIPNVKTSTVVREMNLNLLGTFNLMNLFGHYKGTPRTFEMIAVAGFGWGHPFSSASRMEWNYLTSKLGLDFAFNLGEKKAWQVYVEPSINYALVAGGKDCNALIGQYTGLYNLNKSMVQLNAGVIYKFKTSNGTHNFAYSQLRDQSEIDGLNGKINSLRNMLNDKDAAIAGLNKQVASLKDQLARKTVAVEKAAARETNAKKEVGAVLQPSVIFRQGKSVIDPAQYAQIEMVAKYMKNHPEAKILVEGYASPEGKAEYNQKLSQARAEVVKNALVKKYKIAEDRISVKGCGITDKLFDEYDFNRVSIFKDTTK